MHSDKIKISELNDSLIKDNFSCGNDEIDDFLQNKASSNQKSFFSKTYVLHKLDEKQIIGFYSLSAARLNTGNAKIFGIDQVPVVLLGRLGIDKAYHKKGLSKLLIAQAIKESLGVNKFVACRLLLVETTIDKTDYYKKMGFEIFKRMEKKQKIIFILDLLKYVICINPNLK